MMLTSDQIKFYRAQTRLAKKQEEIVEKQKEFIDLQKILQTRYIGMR
jgi:hypothetical protein